MITQRGYKLAVKEFITGGRDRLGEYSDVLMSDDLIKFRDWLSNYIQANSEDIVSEYKERLEEEEEVKKL